MGQVKKVNRWLAICILGMGTGMTYELPYLRYTYHEQMVTSMGYSNTQLGLMMSIFGIVAMCLYAPSGVLADKFSHKKLITAALVGTGALGFVFASYPPFWLAMVVQVLWAITTTLFMWVAALKAVMLLGTDDESGNLLGWLEGFRGLGTMLMAGGTMWIFVKLGGQASNLSLRGVIWAYSATFIIFGILCYLVVPEGTAKTAATATAVEEDKRSTKEIILYVLKKPTTWYCCFIIFGVYSMYAVLSYTQSYLVHVFGMSVTTAGVVSIVRNQVLRTISPPLGGLITRKTPLKSPTKIIVICACLSLVGLGIFIVTPATPALLVPMIGLVMLLGFSNYISRGMYFAPISEVKTPTAVMGTTIGICSVIGFLPDIFIYPIIGNWQDTLPTEVAYRNMWLLGAACTCVALVAGFMLMREIAKANKQHNQSVSA